MTRLKLQVFVRIFFFAFSSWEQGLATLSLPLLLASLPALTGCAAVKVKLGTRVYLKKIPVTSMEAKLMDAKQAKGPGIAPGEKLPLIATFISPDGKVFITEGEGHGKILWKDLKVTATVATVNGKGVVALPEDPRVSEGKPPHIIITAPSHPDLHVELDVPLRYDHSYTANYFGSSGITGSEDRKSVV